MGRALQRGTPLEVPGLPALTYRLSAVQRVGWGLSRGRKTG